MKEEKVIVDESFVLRFEDSTQPAKRIKQEPTDPDIKESKVFVDAITQTEAFDADLKVEIATQTGDIIIFSPVRKARKQLFLFSPINIHKSYLLLY